MSVALSTRAPTWVHPKCLHSWPDIPSGKITWDWEKVQHRNYKKSPTILPSRNVNFWKKDFYLFIWQREREREHKQGERQRQREKPAPRWASSPMWDMIPGPWDRHQSQRQKLNQQSHPGAPKCKLFVYTNKNYKTESHWSYHSIVSIFFIH